MSDHQAEYPIASLCRALGVSRSGYYLWRQRTPGPRQRRREALGPRILQIHKASRGTYGSPRIHAELKDDGEALGRKLVARIMRELGIAGASRRRSVRTTRRAPMHHQIPDLVQRDFQASAPDELWVADITYINTRAGVLYLAVVMDAWSRRIVGWQMDKHMRQELVLRALDMAIAQRRPVGVIHHSDRGSQYTSLAFHARCKEAGIHPSMGRIGDSYDNAMCESFFATMKTEEFLGRIFRTRAEAENEIFQFIEGWYNPRRRHSGIDYLSPIKYENKAKQAPEGVKS